MSIPYSNVFLHGKEIIIRIPKGLAKKGTTAKELHETAVWGTETKTNKTCHIPLSAKFLCQSHAKH